MRLLVVQYRHYNPDIRLLVIAPEFDLANAHNIPAMVRGVFARPRNMAWKFGEPFGYPKHMKFGDITADVDDVVYNAIRNYKDWEVEVAQWVDDVDVNEITSMRVRRLPRGLLARLREEIPGWGKFDLDDPAGTEEKSPTDT